MMESIELMDGEVGAWTQVRTNEIDLVKRLASVSQKSGSPTEGSLKAG